MKCAFGLLTFGVLLALSGVSRANPVDSNILDSDQIERDRRQAKSANVTPQADVKTLGFQIGGAQSASQAQAMAGAFPFGAGNMQIGRYAGLTLGAYPGPGPLNGGLGLNMGAGLPGGFGAGIGGGIGYPGAGLGAGIPNAGFAFNPVDPYGNYGIYNGMMPAGGPLQNNFMGLSPNGQNLDNLVNYSNMQGLANGVGGFNGIGGVQPQLGNLQGQASQLQPQVAPYPLLPGGFYPQMGYGNYQGFNQVF